MINIESAMNELGVDAVTGVEFMDWLGISTIDLGDPQRFSKLSQVIAYFKDFPIDTQRYMIRRAVNGKNVDKLSHVWEYSQLLKQKKAKEDIMEKIKTELSALGEDGYPILKADNERQEEIIKQEIGNLNNEINIYEK